MNIFNNFIPNEISKFDFKKPVWMNKEVALVLTNRSKFTKRYYNDPRDHNTNLLVNVRNECIRLIIAAKKKKNNIRLSAKLEDPNTDPKT